VTRAISGLGDATDFTGWIDAVGCAVGSTERAQINDVVAELSA
jgi:hypothetical protein